MVDVQRMEGVIQVESGHLRFALHLDSLAMEISDPQRSIVLGGFLPRVVTAREGLLPAQARADGYGDVRSKLGVATRTQVRAALGSGLELTLSIDFADSWHGLVLDLVLENRGERIESIAAIDPCWWSGRSGGVLTLPHGEDGSWFFCMGFQSHSRSGFMPLLSRWPARKIQPDPHPGPFTPPWQKDRLVSDLATGICAPDRGGITLGFLSHERFFSHVSARVEKGVPYELLASMPAEGFALPPRASLRAERLWIGIDPPGSDGIATWAEHTASEMGVQQRPGATAAWSSRHAQLRERGVFALREAIPALLDLDAGIEMIEIDDGYASQLGDWLDPSDGFPEGVAPVCQEIQGAGFQAGVWIAPFLAAVDSQLVRRHPDWLARDARGNPAAPLQPAGIASPCVAIDPGHPEVREWLAELTRTLYAAGCRRLRLDWLAAGTRPQRRDDGQTTVEAYRGALAAIRSAAAQTPILVGSHAPLGPSIALLDAIRSGPDWAETWRAPLAWSPPAWFRTREAEPPSGAERSVCNVLARAPLRRLWQLDPDCLHLGESHNRLSAAELCTVAGAALLGGGLISFSGQIRDLGRGERQLLRRMLPALGRAPEIGAPVRGPDARLCARFPDGTALLLLPNLLARPRRFELDLPSLGLVGPHQLWDSWADRDLGRATGRWTSPSVPARGALLVRLSPADGRPRVIGSSLHLAAGAVEVSRLRSSADGSLLLRLRQPGASGGTLTLLAGAGEPLTLNVSFREELELQLGAEGLEHPAENPDA